MVIPRGNLQITIFFTIDGFLEFFLCVLYVVVVQVD